MTEDDHPCVDDGAYFICDGDAAFEFNGVHVCLFVEANCVGDSILTAFMIRTERHIADKIGVGSAAAHTLTMGNAHVHGDGNGTRPAIDNHAHGVTAEYHIHPSFLSIGGEYAVVYYNPAGLFSVFFHLI